VAKARELEATKQDDEAFNPFGLPTSTDAKPRGTVVLHGGAGKSDIIDLYPKLTQSPKPRLVLCPAGQAYCRPSAECNGEALNRRLEQVYAPWRQLQIDGRAEELSFLTTSTAADANRADFVEPLTRADAVWFGGGDQKWLADLFVDRLKPTLVQQEIFGVLRRGGVVGGASAGLAIMPDVMIEGGESVDGRPAKASLSRGLGVLKHVLAEQHFDARTGRIERFTGLLRGHKQLANFSPASRPKQMIGLAVEEDTALITQANRLRVVGRKLAHVFLQASDPSIVTWHALKPGDSAVVRQSANGYELELEDWVFDRQK
jgi:cyanophycinase